jgi:hypothetical protein
VVTVDANGAIHVDGTLDGETYPKIEDSKLRAHDLVDTLERAESAMDLAGSKFAGKDREIQYAYIVRGSDGVQIEKRLMGKLKDIEIPDPEPEEEETEPEA